MAFAVATLPVTELLASISLATDLATGQPMGHGLSTSVLATTLAREMGCRDEQVRRVQQVSLIRFLGCTSDAAETSRMTGGDELSFMAGFAPVHMGSTAEVMRGVISAVGAGQPASRRVRLLASALVRGDGGDGLAAHCEVGAMLARRLGLDDEVILALQHAYERWDGKGDPAGLAGEGIPLEVRIATVARDVDLLGRLGQDVPEHLRRRRGKAYDPDVVDLCLDLGPAEREVDWSEVIESEPRPYAQIDDLDLALTAVADFADLKSRWSTGHSRRVAELAGEAGRLGGLADSECLRLQRAGLVHDVGRVGIEDGIWDKTGALGTGEWEKVRLHPYLTGRILSRCKALEDLGNLAVDHHERLDGSGYHRQVSGDQISDSSRILAAADSMAALTSDRPHRERFGIDQAASFLETDARVGRLDTKAVGLVIAAAGGRATNPVIGNPGQLTDREVEVLRLISRGRTNRQVGEELFISPKTVGRHVENIYSKIGVSTRAGAAVFAMEHHLLH